ncbi:hypothetical protein EG240_09180 [Paenimyroides tangerinum]|uniref:YARHG domain-containing protein n=1 Tax=Paenimyroides tangerinum TaxID=2488728 RepID=A0A3P3W5A1_9FLAO|nr:hypothetical protein [Paenimyroides tangerinum]RRJ90272.1 hypothetical protein EG240_09180 [Paenimyroides tangerinum]
MKKIIIVSALVLAFSGYAQKKQIVFDNVLDYSYKSPNNEESKLKISYYLDQSRKFNFIQSNTFVSTNDFAFFNNGRYLKIDALGFDRSLIVNDAIEYTFPKMKSIGDFFKSNIVLESMNKKGNFMGLACDFYTIKSDAPEESNLATENVCLCIDSANKVKNLKALLPNANMDGLILAYGHVDYPGEEISLNAIRKVDIEVDFDFNEEYKKQETAYNLYLKEKELEEHAFSTIEENVVTTDNDPYYDNYYNDPLCNNYEYFQELEENTKNYAYKFTNLGCDLSTLDSDYDRKPDMTREQAIQIAMKQSEVMVKQGQKSKIISKDEAKKLNKAFNKLYTDATAYVPKTYVEEAIPTETWATAEEVDYGYRSYSSDYKSMYIDNVSLAAETQLDNSIQNLMPNYCFELKQNVPNFQNENLKKHVYNLVGQICDLYLYQNGGSVDYFGTIDSMRKSLLEIENMRGELSKNDTKLLNEYLNSLD